MKRAMVGRGSAVWGVFMVFTTTAAGSEIGQQVASRISPDTYNYYLSGRLYAHDGDNRYAGCPQGQGPQHDLARENIVAALANCGLNVELEEIEDSSQYNVVATQLGTLYPDSYYIVGAHFDSAGTPGANDNGSGVAGVLEIARVLSLYQTDYTIKYIAFDQEECGLWGSYSYAMAHQLDPMLGMVSLDMIGWLYSQPECDICGDSLPWMFALADALATYGDLTAQFGRCAWYSYSDDHFFAMLGFQACRLTESKSFPDPYYHDPEDSVDSYYYGPDGEEVPYINTIYAANMTRGMAGLLADRAGAQPRFDCASGAGCEPGDGNPDCNGNGIRDLCDVFCGTAADCNGNHVPDECETDCNGNGVPDDCDLANATSTDINGNGIPDECENVGDLNCDGVTDFADINPFVLYLSNFATWQATFPGCDPLNGDINGDGVYGQASFGDINPFVFLLAHR
jgi:hypothetical protein